MNFHELTKIILHFNNVDSFIVDKKDIEYMVIGNVTENFYLTSKTNLLKEKKQITKSKKYSNNFILIFNHYKNQEIIDKISSKNLSSISLVDQSSPNQKNRIDLPWDSTINDENNDLMDYKFKNGRIYIFVSEKGEFNYL